MQIDGTIPTKNDSTSKSELSDLLCPWKKLSEEKPRINQKCIVAATVGSCSIAQHASLIWVNNEFVWADDLDFDPFPSELATHWIPWPLDPVT